MSTVAETPVLTPQMVVEDYRKYKASNLRGRSVATANWVTTLAHPCAAYAVYMRTVPAEQRRALPEHLGALFSEGNDQARAVKRDLIDFGYEVEGAESQLAWPKYQITGREDLKIRRIGMGAGVDTEVKSCSPYSYDKLNTPEDFWGHKWPFIVKWARQIALYMVLKSVSRYWMLLKNKNTGQIKIVEFTLGDRELQEAEAMIQRAEQANKLVQIGQMPTENMKISDSELCSDCEFFTVCLPNVTGPTATILTDERAAELEQKTKRLLELKPLAKEYDDLDEEVKDEVKGIAGESDNAVVFGDVVASLKRIQVKGRAAIPASGPYTQVRVSFTVTGS